MAGQYFPIIFSSVYEHNKEADSDRNTLASLLPSSLMTLDMLRSEPQLPLSQVDLLIKISPPMKRHTSQSYIEWTLASLMCT